MLKKEKNLFNPFFLSSIKNTDLSLDDMQNCDTRFSLVNKDGGGTLVLCASSAQTKQLWVEKIRQQLDNQIDFLAGNVVGWTHSKQTPFSLASKTFYYSAFALIEFLWAFV